MLVYNLGLLLIFLAGVSTPAIPTNKHRLTIILLIFTELILGTYLIGQYKTFCLY